MSIKKEVVQEWKIMGYVRQGDYERVGDTYMEETYVDGKFVDGDDLRNAIIMCGGMRLVLDFRARVVMQKDGDLRIDMLKEVK